MRAVAGGVCLSVCLDESGFSRAGIIMIIVDKQHCTETACSTPLP